MNARDPIFNLQNLPDIQASADSRKLPIQRVGVKGITHPLHIQTDHGAQPTIAQIDMYVALPEHQKGTHMSRFLEVLHEQSEALCAHTLAQLLKKMLERLGAEAGAIELSCPYFIKKTAPVSGVESLMNYEVRFVAEQNAAGLRLTQEVSVPVTSLCPCSKEISDYGAHNQRSQVIIAAELAQDMSIDEQIGYAEAAASCELWGLLKRPDEKYVTERAYENPKFVEDMVRDVAAALDADPRILAYRVSSENFESIHNHSAFAQIEKNKRPT